MTISETVSYFHPDNFPDVIDIDGRTRAVTLLHCTDHTVFDFGLKKCANFLEVKEKKLLFVCVMSSGVELGIMVYFWYRQVQEVKYPTLSFRVLSG